MNKSFGYVKLVDHMGSDLSVVNAARASYAKESKEFNDKDAKLLKFLWANGHKSPFRHATLSFEINAPLMVCRQWWKYSVGSAHLDDGLAHNEASYRYISLPQDFYAPAQWRTAPANSKQGSGGPVSKELNDKASSLLDKHIEKSLEIYEGLIDAGVAPEQARLFLPAYGMFVTWRWSASLAAVMHFLDERLADDAQQEIQEYAKIVHDEASKYFKTSLELIK